MEALGRETGGLTLLYVEDDLLTREITILRLSPYFRRLLVAAS